MYLLSLGAVLYYQVVLGVRKKEIKWVWEVPGGDSDSVPIVSSGRKVPPIHRPGADSWTLTLTLTDICRRGFWSSVLWSWESYELFFMGPADKLDCFSESSSHERLVEWKDHVCM
ncbi:hypothetical protein K443DRAFT_367941 [Laccaria amethystina LaAM-08-1]|uniref:Uncharacterized protein n=1 Tax=Laccaria amethystina LaAM-08-1 TaxID=1095629 RepID=A0A0C9XJJ2_9AGAR|nr:hypothetical protein K443DRAFT_367941 [Laccaria amethystina LaAM-08-1]